MAQDLKDKSRDLEWKKLCPCCGGDKHYPSDKGMDYLYCKKYMTDFPRSKLLPAFKETVAV